MERRLGTILFIRRSDGYVLTAAGERVLAHAATLESELFALGRSLAAEQSEPLGTVTVTLTEALAEPFLVPLLPRLRERHPGLALDLLRDDRSLNLSRREADVALRLARPRQEGLKIRRIGTLGFGVYGAPDYLERRGTPTGIGDLAGHDYVDWRDDQSHIGPVAWWRTAMGKGTPVLRVNSAGCRLAAARAGLGLALVPCIMTERTDRLVRLLPDLMPPGLEIWLVVHRDLARTPRIRAVLDFIADEAERSRARRRGDATSPASRERGGRWSAPTAGA